MASGSRRALTGSSRWDRSSHFPSWSQRRYGARGGAIVPGLRGGPAVAEPIWSTSAPRIHSGAILPHVSDWRTYEEALNDLSGLPAGERMGALLTVWSEEAELLSIDEMRKLFVYAWPDGRTAADSDKDDM